MPGPPPQIRPHDRWRCHGCGQLLRFDDKGLVSQEQLDACRSQCDWELVERDGRKVEDGPSL